MVTIDKTGSKTNPQILVLKSLPQEIQDDLNVTNYYLKENNLDMARRTLRLILEWHTDNNIEVCQEIQIAYGKLVGLEIKEEKINP